MRRYRSAVLEVLQSYPAGAAFVMPGQVPLGLTPGVFESGTQNLYWSVQLLGTPQLSYLRSERTN